MGETMLENFVVWVGGVEVNDFYLTQSQAINLADQYIKYGYDDVIIENIDLSKDGAKLTYGA